MDKPPVGMPKEKETVLGQYVTSAQAYERWKAAPDDTLMVMCRSGGRSAIAANLLAQAGFEHVHDVIEGMEGDTVEEAESVFVGQRMGNGWKNSGCPWTYALTPERMRLPAE